MKKRMLVVMLLAVFVLSVAAFAQNAGPDTQANCRLNPLMGIAKELELSKEQVQTIAGLVRQFHTDAREVAKSSASQQEKKEKIQALRDAAEESILNVLDAEQRAKAEKMNLVKRLLRKGAKPGIALRRALAQLNLTEQQSAAIKTIMEECAATAQAIREDGTLSPEEKREQLQENRQETLQLIKNELDQEQLEKLEKMLEKWRERPRRPYNE